MLQVILIVLAGAAVYANTMNVDFVLDDYTVIKLHGPRNILETLLQGGSRRVADATLALNYHLHGLQVTGYHLVNLAVHLSASIALYFMVVSALAALRAPFPPCEHVSDETTFVERFVPFAVATLFAVHPVQTQAVTYIVQRSTSLATLFYLLSALFFLRARIAFERNGTYRYPLFLGGISLLAAFLALGSKQIAATLPVMLIILEVYLFRGRLINRRFYIICGTLALLALSLVLISWHGRSLHDLMVSLHHATSEDRYISRATYALTQTRVVATYLRLLILPFGQSLFHDYSLSTTLFSLRVIASLSLHVCLIMSAAVLFRVSGRYLGPDFRLAGVLQRLASLGIVWFYVAMAIESSIFPITDVIFEHRIYLPSVGFFLAAVAGTALVVNGGRPRVTAAWALFAAATLILGGLTIARNQVWSDSLALWQDTARKAPNKDLALANLAGEYMNLDMPDKALPLFVRALELNPEVMVKAKVYLGMTLQRLNVEGSRFTTGEEIISPQEYTGRGEQDRTARIRLDTVMYNNLGLAYEYLGAPFKAKESYRAALRVNPAYDLAWYNLGLLSKQTGDGGLAAKALTELKRLNPPLAERLETTRMK
jgi:hypothetical protein